MDIVAHGLWAGALGKLVDHKPKFKARFWHFFFWGAFPDLFAFTATFTLMIWFRFLGEPSGPKVLFSRALRQALPEFLRPDALYPLSHSLPVFIALFGAAWLLRRRPALPMLGWPLHILMDIPTHGGGAYRTPFLWPLSDYRFTGIWWSQRWFMILNYSLIAAVYLVLLIWPRIAKQISERRKQGMEIGGRNTL